MNIKWKSIEVLRFVAAMIVFFAHIENLDVPILKYFFSDHLFLGSIGVDIFFVISGFVMANSLEKIDGSGLSAALRFMIRRIGRIFPLYLFITLLVYVLFNKCTFPGTARVIKSLLLYPEKADPIVYMGWSLRFELFFYLSIAFGILVNKKILTPVLIIIISVVLSQYFNFYYGAPMIIEFIFGFIIYRYRNALMYSFKRAELLKIFLFLVSIGLCLLASLGTDTRISEADIPRQYVLYSNGWFLLRPIAWGIPSFLLVAAAVANENIMSWRGYRLGAYTYSIYLTQIIVLNRFEKIKSHSPNPTVAFIYMILFLGIFSFLAHHLIEKRFYKNI